MATRVGTYSEDDLVLNNAGVWQIGDIAGVGNGLLFRLNDNNGLAEIQQSTQVMLSLDAVNGLYHIGDKAQINNGTALFIDDPNSSASIETAVGQMLTLIQTAGFYSFGDLGPIGNGTVVGVDDATGTFFVANTGNTSIININGVNGFSGTVAAPATITVDGGIVTNVA